MKFDASDNADGSQVDDRRGARSLGVGAGGLGVVGTVVFLIYRFLSGDVGTTADPGAAANPGPQGAHTPLTGTCQGVTSESDPAKFVVCVETNVQSFWSQELGKIGGKYRPAKLVLFTERTSSSCGVASAESGPFYCPPDEKVYLDLGFFQELQRRFHARGGDFAEAYVVAHEYGHHVQDILGVSSKVHEAEVNNPSERNGLSVRLELQADCYAGVWGHHAYEKGKVSQQEISLALDAAAAVGDDRIQRASRGRVNPETFTHGSAAMRQKWFGIGMKSGDPNDCRTFSGEI